MSRKLHLVKPDPWRLGNFPHGRLFRFNDEITETKSTITICARVISTDSDEPAVKDRYGNIAVVIIDTDDPKLVVGSVSHWSKDLELTEVYRISEDSFTDVNRVNDKFAQLTQSDEPLKMGDGA
jgi:hypothetical protein